MPRRWNQADIKVDDRQIKKLLREKGMRRVLEDRTERVAEASRNVAPVRSGAYRRGITPVVEKDDRGNWEGRVEGRHFTSHWIEFGTLRQRAAAPLRRGLEAVFGTIDTTDERQR